MKTLSLAFALTLASPTQTAACHLFSIWRYPTPQHCAVTHPLRVVQREAEELPLPPVRPLQEDERTPDQIRDQAEHDAAVAKYRDYLNAQIKLLHLEQPQ